MAEPFRIRLGRGRASRSRQVFGYAESHIPGGELCRKLQLPQQALQVRWRRSERPFRNRFTRDLPEGLDDRHEFALVRYRCASDSVVILWKNVERELAHANAVLEIDDVNRARSPQQRCPEAFQFGRVGLLVGEA